MAYKNTKQNWCFYGNFIPRLLGVQAIVLWPFVLFAQRNPSTEIIAHEFIHMDQIRKNGVIKFYLWYFIEYVIGRLDGKRHYDAYRDISFEVEAFQNQKAFAKVLREKFPDHYA